MIIVAVLLVVAYLCLFYQAVHPILAVVFLTVATLSYLHDEKQKQEEENENGE